MQRPIRGDHCNRKRRHKEESHMKTEAETGVRQLPAREHVESPEAGRGQEGFSPWNFRRNWESCGEAVAVLQVSDGGDHNQGSNGEVVR